MPISKLETTNILKEWLDTINALIDSTGDIYRFTQKIDTDGTDPDNSESFEDALDRFIEENGDVTFKKNDVAIVTLVDISDASAEYEKAAYTYDGTSWVACTGLVDADKVIMRSDITLAGDYTAVGNLTKTKTGTAVFNTKGMSVADAFTEMLSKRLQPSITKQPSVSAFSLTAPTTTSVEAGTKFTSMSYSAGTFEDGAYTYSNTTGATVTNWTVQRITNTGTTTVETIEGSTLSAGSDDNGGNGFIIGDSGGDYTYSSVKYKATATYGEGSLAKDNLGADCTNDTKIEAGSESKDTASVTCYRNYFYGAPTDNDTIDGAYIRNLTKSGKAYAAGQVSITTVDGSKRIVIACIDGKTGLTAFKDTNLGADTFGSFSKSQVSVEGANGYSAKTYNVWVWEPAQAWSKALTYKATLG